MDNESTYLQGATRESDRKAVLERLAEAVYVYLTTPHADEKQIALTQMEDLSVQLADSEAPSVPHGPESESR
jgi:hypothetical protein